MFKKFLKSLQKNVCYFFCAIVCQYNKNIIHPTIAFTKGAFLHIPVPGKHKLIQFQCSSEAFLLSPGARSLQRGKGGLRLTNGPLGASASDTIGALLTVLRSSKKDRVVSWIYAEIVSVEWVDVYEIMVFFYCD